MLKVLHKLYYPLSEKEVGVSWGRKHLYLSYAGKQSEVPVSHTAQGEIQRKKSVQSSTWRMIPFNSERDKATDSVLELLVNEQNK